MDHNLVLYGAGKRCKRLCKILNNLGVQILAVVDSDSGKWGTDIEGYTVNSPQTIKNFSSITLCITILNVNAANSIRTSVYQAYQGSITEVQYLQLILAAYQESPVVMDHMRMLASGGSDDRKIMFSCPDGFVLGGIEAWTVDICKALISSGKDNICIIVNRGPDTTDKILSNHIVRCKFNHDIGDRFLLDSIVHTIDIIVEHLPCKIVTRSIDEVTLAAYLVKKFFPNMIEIISVVHGGNEEIYHNYLTLGFQSDIYIGVSQDIKNAFIQKGIAPEKVYSMTCPFPCEERLNRTYTENSLRPICIGYAGRMDGMEKSQKRMDLMLELMKCLKETGTAFSMEFAGEGIVRKSMEEFVKKHNLEEQVHFLGQLPRTELAKFWKRQDICVNLADYEGRSLSIIEAMGNGAVPIVTATSGVREDIEDGVNGYIVPLGDVKSMTERIMYLAEHREQLPKMGQRAHDVVYPKSLMESHLKFWERILR